MKFKKLTIIFVSIITIAFSTIFGLEWWNTNKSIVSTDNAYVRSSITTMSSRISSYILEVPALTHSVVKKNDLLVILDPEPYQNKVNSLNPYFEIDQSKILKKVRFTHPYFDQLTLDYQSKLENLQNKKNILFCGSYFGYGFHEDGLNSGMEVAKKL